MECTRPTGECLALMELWMKRFFQILFNLPFSRCPTGVHGGPDEGQAREATALPFHLISNDTEAQFPNKTGCSGFVFPWGDSFPPADSGQPFPQTVQNSPRIRAGPHVTHLGEGSTSMRTRDAQGRKLSSHVCFGVHAPGGRSWGSAQGRWAPDFASVS